MERAARISALHREQLSDIAEFDRAKGWRGDGAVSMIAWVTAQCGVSTSTARQWVRSAVNLESLPCLAEGLASGELSLDLVEPLAEVASPSSDAALREASAHWNVRQARELAAWHKAREEAEAEARAAAQAAAQVAAMTELDDDEAASALAENSAARDFERRTLRFNDSRQSMWVSFPKDDFAVVKSRSGRARRGRERTAGFGCGGVRALRQAALRRADAPVRGAGRHRRRVRTVVGPRVHRRGHGSSCMRRSSCWSAAPMMPWPRSPAWAQFRLKWCGGWPATPTWTWRLRIRRVRS